MRFIDADEFKRQIVGMAIVAGYSARKVNKMCELIDKQPTAYDVDKVVKQLENERKFWENAYDSNLGKEKARSYEHAIEIVKAGGIVSNQDNMDARR